MFLRFVPFIKRQTKLKNIMNESDEAGSKQFIC